jgi:hypothetical protein
MSWSQKMSQMTSVMVLALAVGGVLPLNAGNHPIDGYWQIASPDSRVVGIVRLKQSGKQLRGYGIRVNLINPKAKLTWTCQHGDPELKNEAVWAGSVFLDMESDDVDAHFFNNGELKAAVGCRIFQPEIVFNSATNGVMQLTQEIDFFDFDQNYTMAVDYTLKKISKSEALSGCSYLITQAQKDKWGDMIRSEKARSAMLKEMRLTRAQWLQKANNYEICFDL